MRAADDLWLNDLHPDIACVERICQVLPRAMEEAQVSLYAAAVIRFVAQAGTKRVNEISDRIRSPS